MSGVQRERPEGDQRETRGRPEGDQRETRERPERETRERPEGDQRETRGREREKVKFPIKMYVFQRTTPDFSLYKTYLRGGVSNKPINMSP